MQKNILNIQRKKDEFKGLFCFLKALITVVFKYIEVMCFQIFQMQFYQPFGN